MAADTDPILAPVSLLQLRLHLVVGRSLTVSGGDLEAVVEQSWTPMAGAWGFRRRHRRSGTGRPFPGCAPWGLWAGPMGEWS